MVHVSPFVKRLIKMVVLSHQVKIAGGCAEVSSPNSGPCTLNVTAVSFSTTYLHFFFMLSSQLCLLAKPSYVRRATTLNGQSKNNIQQQLCGSCDSQLTQIEQSMSDSASFLQTLSHFVPTLQETSSAVNRQLSESSERKNFGDTMRDVYETTSRTLQIMRSIQAILPQQVERQQPVYFQDAYDYRYPFALKWIASWEELLAVLGHKFKSRGLRVVGKRQFVLEDGIQKRAISLKASWESSFYPGQNVNMNPCFDEKEESRNCCPTCRHVEPVAVDEAVDWYGSKMIYTVSPMLTHS